MRRAGLTPTPTPTPRWLCGAQAAAILHACPNPNPQPQPLQAAAILYACPLLGDAVQFIVIDRLQAAQPPCSGPGPAEPRPEPDPLALHARDGSPRPDPPSPSLNLLQAARGPAPGRRSLGSSRPSVMARVSHVLAPFSARRSSDGSPHDDELGRRILLTPSQPTSHDPSPDGSRAAAAAGPPDHRLP